MPGWQELDSGLRGADTNADDHGRDLEEAVALLDPTTPAERAAATSGSLLLPGVLKAVPLSSLRFSAEDRLALAVVVGTTLLWQLGVGCLLPLLPSRCQEIGIDEVRVGIIVGVPSVARMLLNLPMGRLVDVAGRRWPMVRAVVQVGGSLINSRMRLR